MAPRARQWDCIVVGGGPAGCITAGRLAEWGRRVLLLDEGRDARVPLEETIGADAKPLLQRHALTASIRAHGFHGAPRAGVAWGDGELRVERVARGRRGFRVVRPLFDRDLRRFAAALGVEVVEGTRVIEARGSEVAVEHAGGSTERLRGRTVVVAAGGAATERVVPVELLHRLPQVLALTALLERPPRRRDALVIEALEHGWTRWLPLGDGRAAATLFADAAEAREVGAARLFAVARRGSSGPFADTPAREVHLRAVDVRHQVATEAVFLCGDAAATVDPLLGQGIERALRSGESCALAVNSCLEDPALTDRVLDHVEAAECDDYLAHARRALSLYLQEVRFSDRPFWLGRHAAVQVEIEPATPALPRVLCVAPDVTVRNGFRPRGRVLEPVRGYGRGDSRTVLVQVACVPVGPLLRLVEATCTTDELLDLASVAPELYRHSRAAVQRALTELVRLGIIDAGGRP